MSKTRLAHYRHNETRVVATGPDARAMRAVIHREEEAKLARYDADPSPVNRAAILTADQVEQEILRRLTTAKQEAA